MTKTIMIILIAAAFVAGSMITGTMAFAAPGDQGKPFEALQAAIGAVDWLDITGIPTDIADGDDNTQLTEAAVDGFVANNGFVTGSGSSRHIAFWSGTTGSSSELTSDTNKLQWDSAINELGIQGSVLLDGQIKIQDGSQAVDKVLASDANGLATWRDVITITGAHTTDTNTNAGTLCTAGQYLDGDGTCKAIPSIIVKTLSDGACTPLPSKIGWCPDGAEDRFLIIDEDIGSNSVVSVNVRPPSGIFIAAICMAIAVDENAGSNNDRIIIQCNPVPRDTSSLTYAILTP